MNILITGGAGYIGSHTVIELYDAGHTAVIVDNLDNSSAVSVERIGKIIGTDVPFIEVDCADKEAFRKVFEQYKFDAAIHFAGLKAVDQSIIDPLHYYRNNLDSALVLCELMQEYGVHDLVFSSSATVYGTSPSPLTEDSQTGIGITNTYGQTKFMIEQILQDTARAYPNWHITLLRYFNPIGAHESGTIGEDPTGPPNNLTPYIAQVAVGRREHLNVFGNDYDTPDGTCLRDYIHVVDLAKGHVAALEHRNDNVTAGQAKVYNLGTGKGSSVMEVLAAFEEAAGKKIPYEIKPRRPGDLTEVYANCDKAAAELGWKAELDIKQACADSWHWQSQNPHGFRGADRED
jgi:UDP-glucose 4-epimerase